MISIVFTPEIQEKIHEIVYARKVETGVRLFGKKEGAVFSVTDACGPSPLKALLLHRPLSELDAAGTTRNPTRPSRAETFTPTKTPCS